MGFDVMSPNAEVTRLDATDLDAEVSNRTQEKILRDWYLDVRIHDVELDVTDLDVGVTDLGVGTGFKACGHVEREREVGRPDRSDVGDQARPTCAPSIGSRVRRAPSARARRPSQAVACSAGS